MSTVDDPQTLASVITALGGQPVAARTMQFECRLGDVKTLVPRLNSLGVRVRKLEGHDRVTETSAGPQTTIRCEVYRRPEEGSEPRSLLDLMPW